MMSIWHPFLRSPVPPSQQLQQELWRQLPGLWVLYISWKPCHPLKGFSFSFGRGQSIQQNSHRESSFFPNPAAVKSQATDFSWKQISACFNLLLRVSLQGQYGLSNGWTDTTSYSTALSDLWESQKAGCNRPLWEEVPSSFQTPAKLPGSHHRSRRWSPSTSDPELR